MAARRPFRPRVDNAMRLDNVIWMSLVVYVVVAMATMVIAVRKDFWWDEIANHWVLSLFA